MQENLRHFSDLSEAEKAQIFEAMEDQQLLAAVTLAGQSGDVPAQEALIEFMNRKNAMVSVEGASDKPSQVELIDLSRDPFK